LISPAGHWKTWGSNIKSNCCFGIDAVLIGPGKLGIQRHIDSDNRLEFSQFSVLKTPFKRDAKYLGVHKSKNMQLFIQRFNLSLNKVQKAAWLKIF